MASTAEWTVLEKLLLAQAVYKFGEDNWFQIARNLKQHSMLNRQPEFFNQKNCSLQYYLLIEDLETEKRQTKSTTSATAQDMPPVVKLAKQLYIQRIDELKRAIKQDDEKFMQLIGEIEEIRAGKWDAKLASQVDKIRETAAPQVEATPSAQQPESQQQQQQQQESVLSSPKHSEKEKEEQPEAEKTPSQQVSPTPATTTPTTTTPSATTATITPVTASTDVQYTPAVSNNQTPTQPTAESLQQTPDAMQTVPQMPSSSPPSSQPIIETSAAVEAMAKTPSQEPVQTPTPDQQKVSTPIEKLEPMEVDTREPDATTVPSVVEETAAPAQALQHEPHVTAHPTVSSSFSQQQQQQQQSYTAGQQKSTTRAMSASPQSDTSYQSALETTPGTALVTPTLDEITSSTGQQAILPSSGPSESEKRKLEDIEMDENDADEQQTIKRQRLEQPSKESTAEYQANEDSQGQLESAAATSMSADEERVKTEPSSEPKSPEAMNLKSPEAPLSVMSGADAEGTESVTGSESNAPTPTSSSDKRKSKDEQRQQKSWQKNINLLWREIANHKNGAMFMNPIKEATAPLYYDVVKHPVDLKTIKNRIRDGVIKTTVEFERDIVLMLTNSLMYNKEGTEIYQMALEMLEDVNEQLKLFKTADSNSSTTATHTRKASTVAKDRRKSVAE